MDLYEREYFVSRIRCGYHNVTRKGTTLKVMPPCLEVIYSAQEYYKNVFSNARSRGVMTEAENLEWMISQGLWSKEKEDKIEGVQKDIENIQVKLYENRAKPSVVKEGKVYLRTAEKALKDLNREKGQFFQNTCEGIASNERQIFIFERSCYLGEELFTFEDSDSQNWFYLWAGQILQESEIREIARSDPWRGMWSMREHTTLIIQHNNRDLNIDQKNIITWSKVYDSIQESIDCPPESVISDDAMLNGWMILQQRESEKSKSEKSVDLSLNPKVASSQEILLMARDSEDISSIENLNSHQSKMVKRQRMNTVKSRGSATDLDFQDKKMELQNKSNDQFKRKFR